jgi:ribosomal protein L15
VDLRTCTSDFQKWISWQLWTYCCIFHVIFIGTSHGKDLVPVNVDRLQRWIDTGRIDPQKPITMKELFDSRLIHKVQDGVKLLGGVRLFPEQINLV